MTPETIYVEFGEDGTTVYKSREDIHGVLVESGIQDTGLVVGVYTLVGLRRFKLKSEIVDEPETIPDGYRQI